jgi:hypothetical protein
MNTRYAGASHVQSLSIHEEKREPDGSSDIDPSRSQLNRLLWSDSRPEPILAIASDDRPRTQQAALEALWASGVTRPAKQSETPYVQSVLSVSPEYFRGDGQGSGEWNQQNLDAWVDATMKWLHDEYGRDLVHVSLHLDEQTPHMHVLIVPTYDKKPRRPGRRNRNETEQEFENRKAAAENAPTTRVAGRASNDYWKRAWARREARKSYHAAVAGLGIGYGKDFIGDDEPSPEHVKTGTWVREQASFLKEKENDLVARETRIEERESSLSESEEQARKMRNTADKEWALAAKARMKAESVFEDVTSLHDKIMKIHDRVLRAVRDVAKRLGVSFSLSEIEDAAHELRNDEISAQKKQLLDAIRKPEKVPEPLLDDPEDPENDPGSFPEDPSEEARDDSPGF